MNSHLRLLLFFPAILFVFQLQGQVENEKRLSMDDMKKAGKFYSQGEAFFENGAYKKAAEAYKTSFEVLGNNEAAAYGAAVSYDAAKEEDLTFKWLEKSIHAGKYDIHKKDFRNFGNKKKFSELSNIARLMQKELNSQPTASKVKLPKSYDKTASSPLLIVFHGFNSNPDEVYKYYRQTAEELGAVVMLPRGDEVIGKNKFAWKLEEEEYTRILEEMDRVILKHNINKEKIILSGISQGGFLTYAMGMVFSDKFTGLIPVAGTVPTNIKPEKIENKDLKVIGIIGTRDSENLVAQNRKAANTFNKSGIEFDLKEFDMNHGYPENHNEVILSSVNAILQK